MSRRTTLLTIAVAACLVAAGCGSEETGGGGSKPQQPAGPTVSMKDVKFIPETVEVSAGETVTWTNDDAIAHTVTKTSGPGPQFDSGTVAGGGRFEQKFDQPGRIDYVCTIHPNQKGAVVVK